LKSNLSTLQTPADSKQAESDVVLPSFTSDLLQASELSKIEEIKPLFDDSSCQVWKLEFKQKRAGYHRAVLKKADGQQNTPFWQMMAILFDVSIAENLTHGRVTYQLVAETVDIAVPQFIEAAECERDTCLLVSEIDGEPMPVSMVDDDSVRAIAQYLHSLHSVEFNLFGSIRQASNRQGIEIAEWSERLLKCLTSLAKKQKFSQIELDAISKQLQTLKTERFVPLMMDLRWDQFAQTEGQISGVFDLDAYVSAPIELDFVILEYLLNDKQSKLFVETYIQLGGVIPDMKPVRKVYRTLFYLVNSMGESDYQKWMSQTEYF